MPLFNNGSNKIFTGNNKVLVTNGGNLEGGLKFNGTSQYVTVPYNALLCPSAVSISFWFRLSGSGSSNGLGGANCIIFKRNSRTSNFEGYVFYFNPSTNVLTFSARDSTGTITASKGFSIPLNSTVHVVGTLDSSSINIYLNGSLKNSGSTGFTLDYSTGPVVFGNTDLSTAAYGYLNGYIFDVKIFNKVLSASEISFMYSSVVGLPTTAKSNLQGWWPLNQNNGKTTRDLSGNNFTGTLNNYSDAETGSNGQSQSGNTAWVRANNLSPIIG